MELSNWLVSWVITYLGDLQPTYIGVIIIIQLLSTSRTSQYDSMERKGTPRFLVASHPGCFLLEFASAGGGLMGYFTGGPKYDEVPQKLPPSFRWIFWTQFGWGVYFGGAKVEIVFLGFFKPSNTKKIGRKELVGCFFCFWEKFVNSSFFCLYW